MPAVVLVTRRPHHGAVVVPVRVGLDERLLHLIGQVAPQARRLLEPEVERGGTARDDHRGDARRTMRRVLHREHAAPRLAEHVHVVEAESTSHLDELLLGELRAPPVGQRRARGLAAAERVVVDDGSTVALGDVVERADVVVRGTGSAVDAEQRQAPLRAIANDAVVGLVAGERDVAFDDVHTHP